MELYINDILVELNGSVPIPFTYHISDIKNPDQRKGSRSLTIDLPGTRKNSKVMSTVYALTTTDAENNPTVADFDTSVKAPARYYQGGVLQFEGIAQLTECSRINGSWTFSIVLFSDHVNIFDELKKVKLRELGWSEYNHALTYSNQQKSWIGSIVKNGSPYNNYSGTDWLGEGYYYGLIDYGYDRPADDSFTVDQIPLQVYVKSIVDKMFEHIDVSYSSTFFGTQQFKRLLLAYEGGVFPEIDAATATANSIETDQDNPISSTYILDDALQGVVGFNDPTLWTFPSNQFNYIPYNSVTGTEVDPSSLIQTSAPLRFIAQSEGDYNLTYNGDHDVTFNVALTGGSGSSTVNAKFEGWIKIYKNGVNISNTKVWENEILNSATLNNSFTATFTSSTPINLQVSDEVTAEVLIYKYGASVVDSSATDASATHRVTATSCELDIAYQTQSIQPGSTVNIKQFLPDMDCATFFKGLVTMFNLYVKPDPTDVKKIDIEPLNTFYNGSNNALNWTHLIDHSKEYKVTPTVNFASKEYIFKFKDDPDYWNARYFNDVVEQYGSKTITSASQFAIGETKYELPFANKLLGQIPNTDLIVPRNFQVKTDETGTSDIVERRGKPFIVQIKRGNVGTLETADWVHIDETDTANSETTYPYVGHLDHLTSPQFDLMFDIPSYVFYDIPAGINYTTDNLYSEHHEKFIKEIVDRNGKLLTCYVWLTPDIINTLDFGNLINIDGVVYRLQKIENYDPTKREPTKCEFIRLIEGESIQTYTVETPYDDYLPPYIRKRILTEAGDYLVTEDGVDFIRQE